MDDDFRWTCTRCGGEFDIWEMGYIGPQDRRAGITRCDPFMAWLNLCKACEEKERAARGPRPKTAI